jgi:hypothetical protein
MENSVLLEAIKQVYPEKTQNFNRFLKMVDFYGYAGTNKSLTDFFKLVLNEPAKFKDMDRVVRKWKNAHNIQNMYSSLLKIYEVSAVKDLISGDKYDLVVNGIRDFLKEATTATAPAPPTTTKSVEENSEIVVIDKSQTDLNTFRMRLSMYCDILDEIGSDNPGIVAVAKMLRYDVGNM